MPDDRWRLTVPRAGWWCRALGWALAGWTAALGVSLAWMLALGLAPSARAGMAAGLALVLGPLVAVVAAVVLLPLLPLFCAWSFPAGSFRRCDREPSGERAPPSVGRAAPADGPGDRRA